MAELKGSIPKIWAETNPPGLAIEKSPVIITLKTNAQQVMVSQYPMTPEAKLDITKGINWILEHGILVPCQFP